MRAVFEESDEQHGLTPILTGHAWGEVNHPMRVVREGIEQEDDAGEEEDNLECAFESGRHGGFRRVNEAYRGVVDG